jgi:hypothetical protein
MDSADYKGTGKIHIYKLREIYWSQFK